MPKTLWVGVAVLLLAGGSFSQGGANDTPLGDVARKQMPAAKKAQRTIHGNGSAQENATPGPSPALKSADESNAGRSPVLDSPKDTSPDVFVVPAGTEIRVSLPDSKVIVPVRVGFATPIPALSHVSIESSLDCDDVVYTSGHIRQHCTRTYWLSAVTIDGKTYEIDTDSKAAVLQEVTFLLARPLTIPR